MRQSKLKIRALLNVLSDLLFVVRKDGLILEFHTPHDNEFMLSAEGLVGKHFTELLPSTIGQQAMSCLEKALRTGHPQTFTCSHQFPGREREFLARFAATGSEEAFVLVRDVTDRKLLEKELVEISNREQMRIGQDLHDGLGQHLTGITFLTRALENKLAARSLPEAAEAAEIGRLVLQALSQTRNLARGLFPVEVESGGLVPALKDLASTVEKLFGIPCVFECDQSLRIRDRAVANHLFRLAQEAINNSVKHGKAKRVVIGLHEVADKVMLTIQDDGVGFSKERIKTKGLGLRIMHYRAQKIGATLEIRRDREDRGTVVTCSFSHTAGEK